MRFLTLFFLLLSFTKQSSAQVENHVVENGFVTHNYIGTEQKARSGMYKNGQREGEWRAWSKEGFLWIVANYHHDTLEGAYTEYYSTGQLSVKTTYLHGKEEGTWASFDMNGKPIQELNFKKGKYDGHARVWNPDGILLMYKFYESGYTILKKDFYNDGRPKAIEYYKQGKKDGTCIYYSDYAYTRDTFPNLTRHYKNDSLHGLTRTYVQGKCTSESIFVHDKICSHKSFYTDGTLMGEEYYKDGKRDSVYRRFESGVMVLEGYYQLGFPIKERRIFYERKGQLKEVQTFANTAPTIFSYLKNIEVLYLNDQNEECLASRYPADKIVTYYKTGKISSIKEINRKETELEKNKGKKIYTYQEFDEQGKLTEKGAYTNELKSGNWYSYYSNRKKKSVLLYDASGKGKFESWYANGKKQMQCDILKENVASKPLVWTETGEEVAFDTPLYNDLINQALAGKWYYNRYEFQATDVDVQATESEATKGPEIEMNDTVPPEVMVSEDLIFSYVEVMPTFEGSWEDYIQKNINYTVFRNVKQGVVFVKFVVEKDGSISNVTLAKPFPENYAMSGEAIRVISAMPKWTPGTLEGKPVRTEMIVPVKFIIK
ncbi:MAG: energy transducer TonB [Bacteroidia bacterium]